MWLIFSEVSGKDYTGGEDLVQFKYGETYQLIKIPIVNDMEFDQDKSFEIELFEPEGGAKLGKIHRTTVTITNDTKFTSVLNERLFITDVKVDEKTSCCIVAWWFVLDFLLPKKHAIISSRMPLTSMAKMWKMP